MIMHNIPYTSTQADDWNTFIKNSKNATFLLNRHYMDYHADRFTDHSLIFTDDTGEWKAVLPANLRDDTLYSHQGLTYGGLIMSSRLKAVDAMAIMAQLTDYCRQTGIKRVVYKPIPYIYHRLPAQEDLYALFRHNAQLIRRDISSAVDLRRPLPLAKGKKYTVKKAQKAGVEVKETTDLSGFMAILQQNLSEKYDTSPTHSADEIALLMLRFPEEIKLFGGYLNGNLIAGAVVYDCGVNVHVQYLASTDEAKQIGALDAVIAHLMETAYAHRDYFEFGISTEKNGTYLNEGLINQKELFGARAVCYDTYAITL